ncbi:MAG: anaerobic ribonucleoside-triphosphate reductase activating protein [bacterium]
MMKIAGFQGVSLIDYPDKVSSVIFTSGCNMRCPFCQNKDLVLSNNGFLNEDDILKAIIERKGFIDGVVITGGEPTIQDGLLDFCKRLKSNSLLVKLDTNGYLPDVLRGLIENKAIDYIALDIKSTFSSYNNACGIDVDISKIKESLEILKNSNIDYEIRTTGVPSLIDEEVIREIASYIPWTKRYVLQQYRNKKTLNRDFEKILPYSGEVLLSFKSIAEKSIKEVLIRGI